MKLHHPAGFDGVSPSSIWFQNWFILLRFSAKFPFPGRHTSSHIFGLFLFFFSVNLTKFCRILPDKAAAAPLVQSLERFSWTRWVDSVTFICWSRLRERRMSRPCDEVCSALLFFGCVLYWGWGLQLSMKQADFINIRFCCCRGCFYQCYGINTAIDILYEYKWSLLFFTGCGGV